MSTVYQSGGPIYRSTSSTSTSYQSVSVNVPYTPQVTAVLYSVYDIVSRFTETIGTKVVTNLVDRSTGSVFSTFEVPTTFLIGRTLDTVFTRFSYLSTYYRTSTATTMVPQAGYTQPIPV